MNYRLSKQCVEQKIGAINAVLKPDGTGTHPSIKSCLEQKPEDAEAYVIYLEAGVYEEQLEISVDRVVLVGESASDTVIQFCNANGMITQDGRIQSTRMSRAVSVNAKDVSLINLTIQNSFDFLANQRKANSDPGKIKNTQAVALLIDDDADRTHVQHCRLISYHDTLYIRGGRSLLQHVFISGTVDFIFGGGVAWFEFCDLNCRFIESQQPESPMGYVCAPCTPASQSYGFVFNHCRVQRESLKVPKGSYGLGRPWHPTTQFSDGHYADPDAIGYAVFMNTLLDDIIYGWDKMGGKGPGGEQIWFYPEQSRFFEYKNSGDGATVTGATRPQLKDSTIPNLTASIVLNTWQPAFELL